MPRIEACDACYAKDKTVRESTLVIGPLAGHEWLLCEEHEQKFAAQFIELMGPSPVKNEGEDE